MKQIRYILIIAIPIFALMCTLWFFQADNASDYEGSEPVFASENTSLLSPSGRYSLTLISCVDEAIQSYRISVCTNAGVAMESEECFRKRDTLLVLWDDSLDRVWAYSADLGTYYWDIAETGLIVHLFADSPSVDVPLGLQEAKPKIFKNKP